MRIVQPFLGLRHNLARKTPPYAEGFSLLELVVVIAILGILISISIPIFSDVRKQAQANQAKNALATILKECLVAELREESTLLADLPSAKATLPGFDLFGVSDSGNPVPQSAFSTQNCFTYTSARQGGFIGLYVEPKASGPGLNPLDIMPRFSIQYDKQSGSTVKTCTYNPDVSYTAGCVPDPSQPNHCPDIWNSLSRRYERNIACANQVFPIEGNW